MQTVSATARSMGADRTRKFTSERSRPLNMKSGIRSVRTHTFLCESTLMSLGKTMVTLLAATWPCVIGVYFWPEFQHPMAFRVTCNSGSRTDGNHHRDLRLSGRWTCRLLYSQYHVTRCGLLGSFRVRYHFASILKMKTIHSSEYPKFNSGRL